MEKVQVDFIDGSRQIYSSFCLVKKGVIYFFEFFKMFKTFEVSVIIKSIPKAS